MSIRHCNFPCTTQVSSSETGRAPSLAVFDARLDELEYLVAALSENTRICVVAPDQDPISEIGRAFETTTFSDVLIFAHGQPGRIELGFGGIDRGVLAERREEIAAWSDHLAKDASLSLYVCDLSADADGVARELARLTGRQVASASGPVGPAKLGGNWDLDVLSGGREKPPSPWQNDEPAHYPTLLRSVLAFDFEQFKAAVEDPSVDRINFQVGATITYDASYFAAGGTPLTIDRPLEIVSNTQSINDSILTSGNVTSGTPQPLLKLGPNAELKLHNIQISNTFAGGGIDVGQGNLYAFGSTFLNNGRDGSATFTQNTGAIDVRGGRVELIDTPFLNNVQRSGGAAIKGEGYISIFGLNSIIRGNRGNDPATDLSANPIGLGGAIALINDPTTANVPILIVDGPSGILGNQAAHGGFVADVNGGSQIGIFNTNLNRSGNVSQPNIALGERDASGFASKTVLLFGGATITVTTDQIATSAANGGTDLRLVNVQETSLPYIPENGFYFGILDRADFGKTYPGPYVPAPTTTYSTTDDSPSVTSATATATEESNTVRDFTFTLPAAAGAGGEWVHFVVNGPANSVTLVGVAEVGSDFTLPTANNTPPQTGEVRQVAGDEYRIFVGQGQTAATTSISVVDDDAIEGAEAIFATVVTPQPAGGPSVYFARPDQVATSIIDFSDPKPLVSLSFPSGTPTEGQTYTGLAIRVTGTTDAATVTYTITPISATGADLGVVTGTVQIPAGPVPKTVPIPIDIIDDGLAEGAETFSVMLDVPPVAGATYALDTDGLSPRIVTIPANGQAELFEVRLVSAGSATVNEGDVGRALTVELVDPTTKAAKAAPAGGLRIDYQVSGTATPGTDYGDLGTFVTIPAGAFSQVLPIVTTSDDVAGGGGTVVVTLSPTSVRESGRNYDVATGQVTQTVTIQDDDVAGVDIRQISTVTTEVGGTAAFEVMLTSQPTANVSMQLASGDTSEVSNGSAVTFTPANWDVPQPVTVAGVDDTTADGNQVVAITPSASSSDPAYSGLPANRFITKAADGSPISALNVTNIDDEGFNILVSAVTGSASEANAGTTANYNLQLSQATTGPVQVTVSGGAETQVSTDGGTTFGATAIATLNGTTPQAVQVRAVDDSKVEGPHNATITHQVTGGTADFPTNLAIAPATVPITDNDTPVASVVKTTNASEQSAILGQVAVQLDDVAPSGGLAVNYTIAGSATNGTDYQTLSGVLNIAAGETGGFIDVLPFNDAIDEQPFETVSVTLTGGAGYSVAGGASGTVNITDNDVAGIRIIESSAATRIEEGGSDTYDIALTSRPSSDVTISVAASGSATPDKSSVTFTPQNWAQPQTVTLSVPQNSTPGDGGIQTVTHSVSTTDTQYSGLAVDSVSVSVNDNDQGGISVVTGAGVAVNEDGSVVDTYIIQLLGAPNSDVVVTLDGGGFLTFSSGTLNGSNQITLNAGNLSEIITVRAVDDSIDFQNPTRTITHTITTSDPFYATQTLPDVTVAVSEDDFAGFTVVESGGSSAVVEGVVNGDSYTIQANSQPQQPVTINLDSGGVLNMSANGGAAVTPNSITIDATNWTTPQTIGLTTVLNDFIATDPSTATITQTVATTSPEYSGLTINPVAVTITDDDIPGIVATPSGTDTTIREGGATDTFSVQLNSQPTQDVTISFNTGTDIEAVSPITITPTNWNQPVNVTLTAIEDTVIDTEVFQLGLSATSADPKYQGLTTTLPVQINDLISPTELADGFLDTLNALDQITKDTLSFEHPLFDVGAVDPEFILSFSQSLVDAVRTNSAQSATELGTVIESAIEGAFASISATVDATVTPTISPTEVTFDIALGNTIGTSAPLNADFGLPAVGFNVMGSIDPSFTYGLNLGVGVSKADGFFIDTAKTGITATVDASLSDSFTAGGNIGFLGINATNRKDTNDESLTKANINFAAAINDLNTTDASTRVTLSDFKAATPANLFNVTFDSQASLGLDVQTSLGGSTAFPSFGFELDGAWSGLTLDSNGKFTVGAAPQIAFNNIAIDAGTFVSDFATPVITKVDSIMDQFRPVLDILNTDLSVLKELKINKIKGKTIDTNNDGQQTLAEVISALPPPAKVDINPFVTVLNEIDDIVTAAAGLVSDSGTIAIDLGSYAVNLPSTGFGAKPSDANYAAVQQGVQKASTSTGTGSLDAQVDSSSLSASKKNFIKSLAANQNVKFPIISDVSQVFGLLTGATDATLLEIDIPELSVGGGIDESFNILEVLKGSFTGTANIAGNFSFGFDTQGFFDWAADNYNASSSYKILDGLYIGDLKDGVDVDEVTADLTFKGGVSVNAFLAKGSLSAGIEGSAGIDFRDTGETAGTADGKIRAISEIAANIVQPWNLFNFMGSIDGFVSARAEVLGAEVGKINISEELLSISYGADGLSISTVFDGPVEAATVFFDADFDGIRDPDEPYTQSGISNNPGDPGAFSLAIPLEIYDYNGNGVIDPSEGRIVISDGFDRDTGDQQTVPYTSAAGWSAASPLTLLAMELAPTDPAAVEASVEAAFGLPSAFDLRDGDPLAAIKANNAEGAAVFKVLGQIQNLIILGANSLGPALDPTPAELFSNTYTLPANDLRKSGAVAIINELATLVKAGTSIDLSDATQLNAIISAAATANSSPAPAGLASVVADIAARNTAINAVSGTGEAARASVAQQIAFTAADSSYYLTLENALSRLLGASVPDPNTTASVNKVASALNLPTGVDLTTFNTTTELASGNAAAVQMYSKQAQVNATLVQVVETTKGAGGTGTEAAALKALTDTISAASGQVDLTDATTVANLIQTVAPTLASAAVTTASTAIASSNNDMQTIANQAGAGTSATALAQQIAAVQKVAQGGQAEALARLGTGEINDQTFTTLVTQAQTASDETVFDVVTDEATVATGNVLTELLAASTQGFTVTAVAGQAANVGQPVTLPSGAIVTVSSDGSYTYNPNGVFDALNTGEQASDVVDISVTSAGGTTAQAKISATINGAGTVVGQNIFGANVASVDILTNGALEAGLADGVWGGHDTALNGWTNSGGNQFEIWGNNLVVASQDGGNLVDLDRLSGTPLDALIQDVTLLSGQQYELTFYLRERPGYSGQTIELFFGGQALGNVPLDGTSGWEKKVYTVTGDGTVQRLEFRELAQFNDAFGPLIDNIALTPIGDSLTGGAGDDTLRGRAGSDTLDGGAGADRLVGGTGADWADYSSSPSAVTVNLTTRAGSGGNAQGDTYAGMDNIRGSAFDDMLTGFNASGTDPTGEVFSNVIEGGAGNDTIDGLASDDTLDGGAGADSILGGNGDDLITWKFGEGSDTVDGQAGTDQLVLDLNDGASGSQTSLAFSVNAQNQLVAVAGTDTLIITNTENIRIIADPDGSTVTGQGALATAGVSQNTVTFDGRGGDDSFDGSGIQDVRIVASGGDGDDTILGGASADIIDGGAGDNTQSGGPGLDTFLSVSGDLGGLQDGETVTFQGRTVIQVDYVPSKGFAEIVLDDGTQITVTGDFSPSEISRLQTSNVDLGTDISDSSLTLASAASPTPIKDGGPATNGDDSLYGSDQADLLDGRDGNDLIDGNAGDDTLDGGRGDDTLRGEDGDDLIHGAEGQDNILGGFGNDDLSGDLGNDFVQGGGGTDTVEGSKGDDLLDGGQNDDAVFGGKGNDTLIGGSGNDTLKGGKGSDEFRFMPGDGTDVIVDFTVGMDTISITNATFGDLSLSGSTISLGGEALANLSGVDVTSLTAADFVFL